MGQGEGAGAALIMDGSYRLVPRTLAEDLWTNERA
jgi:hypothetical protein